MSITVSDATPRRVTTKEFAALIQAEYASANQLLKLLVAGDVAQEVGSRPNITGKGKPSKIFSVPTSFSFTLG